MLLAVGKNFYLWLSVKKMHAFAIFRDKYLRSYGCTDINVTVTVSCTNPKTQILSEIMETQIVGIPIDFLFFC